MISLQDLTKRYADTTAVAGWTLNVTPGKVAGFLGPNGVRRVRRLMRSLAGDGPEAGISGGDHVVSGSPA